MAQATRTELIGHAPIEPSVPARRRRARWRKLVVLVFGVVAILMASYMVVANVLLRTRLLRNAVAGSSLPLGIGGDSMGLRLDYESAYSFVPGRVHVEGLTIRGRDRAVEWLLTLDRADFHISFVDLFRRTFRASHIRARGFTIRARLRLDRVDATPEVVAAVPRIAGFADPPLVEEGPEPPPLTDANYNLWTANLEDVDLEHVREVWIQTVRVEGDARVRGRWLFRPMRWLDVGPATVDVNGVDLLYGTHPLATGLRGSFGTTVHPFDVRYANGLAVFEHVSYEGKLGGHALVAGALRLLAPRSGVSFTRGEGPLDARIVLDHGKLAAGTRVRTGAADLGLETKGLVFAAPIHTELVVDGDLATLDMRVSDLRVSQPGVERARVASIAATVTSRRLELARVLDDTRFTVDVGGAETNDVGAWTHLFPSTSPFVIRSGAVTGDGHAEGSLTEGRGRATLRLLARHLTVERGDDQFTADVTSDAKLLDGSLPGGWVIGSATITADDAAVRLGRATVSGNLVTHVDLRRGTWKDRTFDLSGSNFALDALSARSAGGGAPILVAPSLTVVAPRLTVAPSGMGGHVSIDLPRADLVDLGRLRELLPLPNGLRVLQGRGRARLDADVDLGSGSMRGDGEVVAWGIRVRLGSTELFGDLAGAVRARRSGGAGSSTDLSGSTLAISHAGTGDAVSPEDAWWGNLSLRNATLRTSGGVRFDAAAHLTAKDASPATVLVSENSGVPTWAANFLLMPHLDVDAQLRVAPSSLEVRSLVARGGGTSLRAEYAKRDGRQEGGVLMDLDWINLGYDLTDGDTGLVILGPESWFGRKTASMRSAAAAAERNTEAAEHLARYAAMTPSLRQDEARALAAQCALDVRSCDSTSTENLLRAATDSNERDTLNGITYAPLVVAAAKRGTDGTTLDPVVMGSVVEALRIGGESTLDNIPSMARIAAAHDSDAARGKVVAVSGRALPIRREGPYSVGTLMTHAEPVYFVTPFADHVPETFAHFRGVFVQRYSSTDPSQSQEPSLVLVGAFRPVEQQAE